jgi:hypothetical protein
VVASPVDESVIVHGLVVLDAHGLGHLRIIRSSLTPGRGSIAKFHTPSATGTPPPGLYILSDRRGGRNILRFSLEIFNFAFALSFAFVPNPPGPLVGSCASLRISRVTLLRGLSLAVRCFFDVLERSRFQCWWCFGRGDRIGELSEFDIRNYANGGGRECDGRLVDCFRDRLERASSVIIYPCVRNAPLTFVVVVYAFQGMAVTVTLVF